MADVDVDGEPVGVLPAAAVASKKPSSHKRPANSDDEDDIDSLFKVPSEPAGIKRRAPPAQKRKTAPPAGSSGGKEKKPQQQLEAPVPSAAAATAATPSEGTAASLFPDQRDYEDLADWVYLTSVTHKVTGLTGGLMPVDTKITGRERLTQSARRLYTRLASFRGQVRNAWLQTCRDSGNADMVKLAGRMAHCKLIIRSGKPKPLSERPTCIWSGEHEELNEGGLLLIDSRETVTLNERKTPDDLLPTMFHIKVTYVNMLKCVHTLLFVLDYVNLDVDAAMRKPGPREMEGPWSEDMDAYWASSFKPTSTSPLAALVKRAKEMLKANCQLFRAELPPDIVAQFLVPIPTGVDGGGGNVK